MALNRTLLWLFPLAGVCSFSAFGCESNSDDSPGSGGAGAAGGSSTASGGSLATGGGATSTGGSAGGGGTATGGGPGAGGGPGPSGGFTSAGGASPGGSTATGGTSASGGVTVGGTGGTATGGSTGDVPPTGDAEPFDSPTYQGSVDNSADCGHTYSTTGYRPKSPGTHPLALYFVGTDVTGNDRDAYKDAAPVAVLEAMAKRGYVAISAQYDNGLNAILSNHLNQFGCLFDAGKNPKNLLTVACDSKLGVDCSKGIATWGHSQGGAIAIYVANVEKRVRAAWITGVSGMGGTPLPGNRVRIVNGADDGMNNDGNAIGQTMGLTTPDCTGQTNQCVRPDGSGWVLVQRNELSPARNADHCWFYQSNCSRVVDPNFGTGTSRISIAAGADWLAKAASTPYPGGL